MLAKGVEACSFTVNASGMVFSQTDKIVPRGPDLREREHRGGDPPPSTANVYLLLAKQPGDIRPPPSPSPPPLDLEVRLLRAELAGTLSIVRMRHVELQACPLSQSQDSPLLLLPSLPRMETTVMAFRPLSYAESPIMAGLRREY